MTLRRYQHDAVEFLLPRRRAFVVAPAGSGKTIMAAAAVARRVEPGWTVGWLCNTIEQKQQAVAAISRVEGPENVSFVVECAAARPDLSACQLVVVDEAHHAPADTWLASVRTASSAVVWGFSATPWHDSDADRNKLVRDTFVDFFAITRDKLLDEGHLASGKVWMHDLDAPGQYDRDIEAQAAYEVIRRVRRFPGIPRFEHERRVRWQITQEFLQANEARNACSVSLVQQEVSAGHSTLVLVGSIEHGEKIAERVGPEAVLVHSKLAKKRRAQLIDEFRTGERLILFATSLADEGLDVPRASRLVLLSGGRSSGKLEQRAGRVLRPAPGKTGGVIHDFLDAGACFALAQARARFKVYERLGYAPEIVRPTCSDDKV